MIKKKNIVNLYRVACVIFVANDVLAGNFFHVSNAVFHEIVIPSELMNRT